MHRVASLRAAAVTKLRSAELLRLGFVMALAMTLHNMPEGFAVCAALNNTLSSLRRSCTLQQQERLCRCLQDAPVADVIRMFPICLGLHS